MNYTRRIACYDATNAGAVDKEKYFTANKFASSCLCDTYIALTEDIAGVTASLALADKLQADGLINTIREFSSAADNLIHSEDINSDIAAFICHDLSMADALQLLRFGKRFSPHCCDGVHDATLTNFLSRNNQDKLRDRYPYNPFIMDKIRDTISLMLSGIEDLLPDTAYDPALFEKGYFSNGSASLLSNPDYKRIKSRVSKIDNWAYPYYGAPTYPCHIHTRLEAHITQPCPLHYFWCEVQIVNKNYKSGRVIAKEEVSRGYYMQGLRYYIDEVLKNNGYEYLCPSEHQEFNQMLAHIGGDDFCTIDLSSASDSISFGMLYEALAGVPKLRRLWEHLRSDTMYYSVGKREGICTCYLANTSGSPLCFDLEKIFFYACARVATDISAAFGHYPTRMCTAMGDDIIIPSYAYDCLIDIFSHLSIKVNEDKSFVNSEYRESCGYEAYQGVTTVTTYWPRKTIDRDLESYDSLRELHNSLFLHGWFRASTCVKNYIVDIVGFNVTTSTLSQYVEHGYVPDLLGFTNTGVPGVSPYYGDCTDKSDSKYAIRRHHCVVQQIVKERKYNKDNYASYSYVNFLINGPSYATPLDKMIGVSGPIRSKNDLCDKTVTKLKLDSGEFES